MTAPLDKGALEVEIEATAAESDAVRVCHRALTLTLVVFANDMLLKLGASLDQHPHGRERLDWSNRLHQSLEPLSPSCANISCCTAHCTPLEVT